MYNCIYIFFIFIYFWFSIRDAATDGPADGAVLPHTSPSVGIHSLV